jgi:hypothetical protein
MVDIVDVSATRDEQPQTNRLWTTIDYMFHTDTERMVDIVPFMVRIVHKPARREQQQEAIRLWWTTIHRF